MLALGPFRPRILTWLANALTALVEMCGATGVDAEHPRPRRLLSHPMTLLNGKLRLPTLGSAPASLKSVSALISTNSTPPKPTSAVRDAGKARF